MKAEILSIGTELLLGDILNTNARFLARELASLGIEVYFQAVVGDNPGRLRSALEQSFSRADMVISTGGLGPTDDDLTKETVAEFFGVPLKRDEESLKRIEKFFKKIKREMTENNIKQADIPEGALVLKNPRGTAPGIWLEKDGKIMVMLPGPPREAESMFRERVRPLLDERRERVFVSRVLRIADIGEGELAAKVEDLLSGENPTLATYAEPMESYLRLTANAKSEEEAKKLLDELSDIIKGRLKEAVYAQGETKMQEVVGKMLMERSLKTAVAESLTGGLVSAQLIENPGISEIFSEGIVAYSNEAKRRILGVKEETLLNFGAVSAECAEEMAKGAAERAMADIGLSTTGIAGPSGGTEEKPVGTVYIGIYIRGKCFSKKLSLAGTRERIRERTVYMLFNELRLALMEQN
ncbi:MAG: competence/damage-inducible protein A [Firmicutes bacterium]|nr:competence/damage-inducible protein A [Bacillota bacterium]